LRGAEVLVADDDRMSKLVGGTQHHTMAAAKRPHAKDRFIAEPDRMRVADERSCRRARDELRAADEESRSGIRFLRLESRESRAVTPRRDLGQQRGPDADELEAAAKAREPDVVGRHSEPRAAEQSLGFVDRFPPLLERREVPAPATRADHPQ